MKTSKRLLSILLMLTMLLSMFTVMASAGETPHECILTTDLQEVEAKSATCKTEGVQAHYICKECGKLYLKIATGGYLEVEKKDLVIPTLDGKDAASHHWGKRVAASDGDCQHYAHPAYQPCTECGQYFKLDDGSVAVATRIIGNLGAHKLGDLVPAEDKDCEHAGHLAYKQCSVCNAYFVEENGTWVEKAGTKIFGQDFGPHVLRYVAEVPATCTTAGTRAHYVCNVCGKYFEDSVASKELKATDLTIAAKDHTWGTVVSAKEKDCKQGGNYAYQKCENCETYQYLKDGRWVETKSLTDIIGATVGAHTLTETKEVAPTCTENGTKAYWTCSVCNKSFEDNAGTKEIKDLDTWKVVPKLGHTWGAWVKNAAGTKETRECSVCHTKEERTIAKEYNVTVKVNNSMRGQVNYIHDGTTTEDISRIAAVQGQDIKLKAVSANSDKYKFGYWVVTGVSGLTTEQRENETLKFTMPANAVTVKAVFILKPVDDAYDWLKLDIGSHGSVEFKDDGTWTGVDDGEYLPLVRGETYKFRADPDSGYKTVWQLDDGSKYTGNTFSFKMGRYDSVLHVYFVSKSSTVEDDYPTLTFDITGGKHGTVYRGTREYEDGDVISIKKNDKMTFKAKADKGYVAVWTYKGESYVGDEFTVKMGSKDATLYIEFMDKDDIRLTELPFRDVSKRDWYYDDVVYVYRKGYMDGMSSTRFGGELNTTRGQIVTILWRLTGEPRATKRNPFTDVSSSQYYYDAISWAYDAGVVDGFDAHTFKPDQNVTREQLAAILYRYAEYMNLSTSGSAYLSKYRDADKIANWAYDAMAWANYRGLINGTSATRIDPKGYATRAQIAAILHRFAVEYGA